MPAQFFAAVLVMTKLVTLKSAVMSADYRGDIARLTDLRGEAGQMSNDRKLGYLADYWSGYASWRIATNAATTMKAEEIQTELSLAAKDFESSIVKKNDFADAYVADAAVHGWLAAFKASDPPAMNAEIEIFKRQIEDGFSFDVEDLVIARALGLKAVEVPVRWSNVEGTKVSMAQGMKSFADLLRIRTNAVRGKYK